MATGNERTNARRRFDFVRRAAIGVGVALAGMGVAAIPASAASQDGTSNTIQFSVASATLDQAHHRVIVTSPTPSGLAAGQHLATAEVVTPRYDFILENTLISGFAGTPSALSLNFTKIGSINYAFGRPPCTSGADVCLIESDGIYPPFA
jgi:hypothetical protein